jgi:RNA polymerase sigma-70 factor (ECF subfamily)
LTTKQEATWVLQAQCGDRDALERLLGSVQPALSRYLRGLIGSTHADDVAQEVLVLAYRKLWWLKSPELFRPWLFRIASRAAFRYLKRERRWPQHLRDDEALMELPAPEVAPSPAAVQEQLEAADVTPASRAVLLLHFQEDMTLQEVAAVLELPVGTVKSRLAYGLAALRRTNITGEDNDRRR